MQLTTITDETRLALANLADRAVGVVAPSLRLGVTGLARAGKTVFIAALVHNLVHGGRLHLGVQLVLRGERLFRRPVGHQLDPEEQAAPADVADMVMVGKAGLQRAPQGRTLRLDVVQQAVAFDHMLDGEAGRASYGMPHIGVPVLEEA